MRTRKTGSDARRDKVKITAQIAACQRGIENLITAVEKGTLEPEEVASRLQIQRAEKARLEQLKQLAALRDSGALTKDEFDAEKRRILEN